MKCSKCGSALTPVTPKVSMCSNKSCGAIVAKSGSAADIFNRGYSEIITKGDVLRDNREVGDWIEGRARELMEQRSLSYQRAVRFALAEALADFEGNESSDEHTKPNHRPGTRAPSHPLPKQVGKSGVEKAQDFVRASGGQTWAEDFDAIKAEHAGKLWALCLKEAKNMFGYLPDDQALAKWAGTPQASEAYAKIDQLLMHKTGN